MTPAATTRYLAFLRGMNVGGHRVSMDDLRGYFSDLGFANVESFIASGNVIFDAPARTSSAALESRIEKHLQKTLGYAVATFLRTPAELTAIVNALPFTASEMKPGYAVHIGFLRDAPSSTLSAQLLGSATTMDAFGIGTREYYWLCRGKSLESLVKWPTLEKATKMDVTMRNLNTVRKLADKYREKT